jgi:hypothetical protein
MAMEPDPLAEKMRQWALIKQKHDTLGARLNRLRDDMMDAALLNGDKDERGSSFLSFPAPVDIHGTIYKGIKRQARTSTVLNEERALEMARAKGISGEVTVTTSAIDLDLLYEAYAQGKLTEAEIDSLFDTKTSHAFKPVEE